MVSFSSLSCFGRGRDSRSLDAVRIHSNLDQRLPSACSDGAESHRWRQGAAAPRDSIYHTQVNKWTDQPTLELMRQLVEYSGFCFLDKDKRGDFKTCEDVYYIGAMGHPGGGRNDIPNRLKRQFYTINLTPPSINSINDIYGQMLAGRFPARQTETDLKLVVNALTKATIKLWTFMQNKMLPTPAKRVAASFPALDGLWSFDEPVRTASRRDAIDAVRTGSNSTKRPPTIY